jgi:hypothetical protein
MTRVERVKGQLVNSDCMGAVAELGEYGRHL